jgi:hypothetical protein
MNSIVAIHLLVFTSTACGVGVLSRLVRVSRRKTDLPARETPWPWFIKGLSGPARTLSPWVAARIPESRLTSARM